MSTSAWVDEKSFVKELNKAIERATESRLKRVADIAVASEKAFYKLVVKILERALKQATNGKSVLHLLFATSEVLRASHRALGSGSKYGERAAPLISSLLLELGPTEHHEKARRILQLWRKESVYNSARLDQFTEQLGVANKPFSLGARAVVPTANTSAGEALSRPEAIETPQETILENQSGKGGSWPSLPPPPALIPASMAPVISNEGPDQGGIRATGSTRGWSRAQGWDQTQETAPAPESKLRGFGREQAPSQHQPRQGISEEQSRVESVNYVDKGSQETVCHDRAKACDQDPAAQTLPPPPPPPPPPPTLPPLPLASGMAENLINVSQLASPPLGKLPDDSYDPFEMQDLEEERLPPPPPLPPWHKNALSMTEQQPHWASSLSISGAVLTKDPPSVVLPLPPPLPPPAPSGDVAPSGVRTKKSRWE